MNSGMNWGGRGRSRDGRRDGIEPSARKWMAAKESSGGKARAAQRAVCSDGLGCVVRTCGDKFAAARVQRMQRGREPAFIEAEQCKQEARHDSDFTGAIDVEFFAERAASASAC